MRKTKNRTAFGRHVRTGVPGAVFERLSPRAWEAISVLGELMADGDGAYQFGDNPTLLDIAVMNGSDAVAGLIDEAATAHPELTTGYARTIRGINYKTLVRTANPSVSFRAANQGSATVKGTYENRLFETFILPCEWDVDQAVGDRHEDGAEALIAKSASGMLEGAMQTLATQFYYGVSNDALGFPGLQATYDSTNMVVDAGGTTSSINTSVYAVRFGPKNVGWIWGNNGELDVSDVTIQRLLDASSNPYWAYSQHLLAYPGLQNTSLQSVGRIHSINGTDANAKLTDDDVADLLATFPAGLPPSAIFMNRTAQSYLRNSRTATNATGAPAPFPDEAFGVPILVTDALVDTEEPG
jgi:hypothetical protein